MLKAKQNYLTYGSHFCILEISARATTYSFEEDSELFLSVSLSLSYDYDEEDDEEVQHTFPIDFCPKCGKSFVNSRHIF